MDGGSPGGGPGYPRALELSPPLSARREAADGAILDAIEVISGELSPIECQLLGWVTRPRRMVGEYRKRVKLLHAELARDRAEREAKEDLGA